MKRRTRYSIVDLIRRDGKWYGGKDLYSYLTDFKFRYSLGVNRRQQLDLISLSRSVHDDTWKQIAEYMAAPCELWSEM